MFEKIYKSSIIEKPKFTLLILVIFLLIKTTPGLLNWLFFDADFIARHSPLVVDCRNAFRKFSDSHILKL